MLAIAYFLLYALCGVGIAFLLLPRVRPVARCWLGLALGLALEMWLPLLCALCSFGGLSILMQNLLFLGKSIRPGRLLACRLLHGAAAYGICGLLVRLFPSCL